MKSVTSAVADYGRQWVAFWNRFWFQPRDAATLCALRVPVGLMLLYTHAVWTFDLPFFFGANGAFSRRYLEMATGNSPFAWSHFWWFDSPLWMWGSHVVCLLVLACFTLGLWSRVTSILSFLIVVSYANRAPGALFGLDQINGFLALYLAVGPSGAMYSLDRWLRDRWGRTTREFTISGNVAIRLIQLNLCIVYLYAGLGKLQGELWWNGEALWGAFASYEYQTLDMTFLADWPAIVQVVTHVTLVWEVTYAFGVWPNLTRPLYLLMAIPVHLGIGLCMGMITFGLIMILANASFVPSALVRRWLRTHPAGESPQV